MFKNSIHSSALSSLFLLDISQTDPDSLILTGESDEKYRCSICEVELTDKNLIYQPNGKNHIHRFLNPGGFVFNLLTFSHCSNYRESSHPEIKDSWFPPYSWIIIHCALCGQLLGWKFVNENNNQKEFFGLIRESIVLSHSPGS